MDLVYAYMYAEKPKVTKSLWTEPLPASFQEVNMRGVTIARRRHGEWTIE